MSTFWIRILGFLMMFFGIALLFSPIIALVKWIPLVGSLLSYGVALAVWIFALVLAFTLSTLTIALAWIYYRPLYGLLLLALVTGGILILTLG
jgi:hypothetical protein